MKLSTFFFRAAAVLILLFAAGHTIGFRQIDPSWGVTQTVAELKTIHFRAQGSLRTYWDFYVGFGLFVSVMLCLAAVTAWCVGGASPAQWPAVRMIAWSVTIVFAVNAVLCWQYFFVVPLTFSLLIFLCLLTGTILANR